MPRKARLAACWASRATPPSVATLIESIRNAGGWNAPRPRSSGLLRGPVVDRDGDRRETDELRTDRVRNAVGPERRRRSGHSASRSTSRIPPRAAAPEAFFGASIGRRFDRERLRPAGRRAAGRRLLSSVSTALTALAAKAGSDATTAILVTVVRSMYRIAIGAIATIRASPIRTTVEPIYSGLLTRSRNSRRATMAGVRQKRIALRHQRAPPAAAIGAPTRSGASALPRPKAARRAR